ncbi:MAG: type II secretion system protein GspG [Victivallales bacterium]|nr:type II secretion system protein GspG [Victivallales bacterium]
MKRSFTVTELLVAIAIIVILAGILIGGIGYAGRRADEAKTIAAIQTLSAALEAFRTERGFFPASSSDQMVKFYRKGSDKELILVLNSMEYKFVDKQGKPFIELNGITATTKAKAEAFADAWETALHYQCPGTHNKAAFDLYSYGPDKTANTEDDIANWDNASQN